MNLACRLAISAMVIAALGAAPVAAGPGRGNGKGAHARHDVDRGHDRPRYVADCPPGLAKKNPPCVPPGQARNRDIRYGNDMGEVLRIGDYLVIRDPRRYDLPHRDDWRYYRDDDRIYRVDSSTNRVLAIMNLIEAFSN